MRWQGHNALAALVGGSSLMLAGYGTQELIITLMGASFPDVDVTIYKHASHRTRSPLHRIEWAVVALFGSLLFFPEGKYFAFGWLLHLLGDFLQGGVGLFGRRVGIKSFRWPQYEKWALLIEVALYLAIGCVSFELLFCTFLFFGGAMFFRRFLPRPWAGIAGGFVLLTLLDQNLAPLSLSFSGLKNLSF